MKQLILLLAIVAASLSIVGCGGNGSSGSGAFAGSWSGIHRFITTLGAVQDEGFISVTVDEFGALSGTMSKTSTQETISVSGFVQSSGEMTLYWNFAGESPRTGQGGTSINGGQWRPSASNNQLPTNNNNGGLGGLEFTMQRN